jgi:hypothetical protein
MKKSCRKKLGQSGDSYDALRAASVHTPLKVLPDKTRATIVASVWKSSLLHTTDRSFPSTAGMTACL